MITVNESQWLSHENIFKQVALKKSIINIKLVEKPSMADCNTKNKMYNGGFDNMTENIMIINARSLLKSFGDKMSFVLVNKTIR